MIRRQTVLVVDDSELTQALLRQLLAELDVHVHAVADGCSAIAAAGAIQPDLVLLDVGLPDTPGLEVCRTLKQSPATHDIPIIFISGRDSPTDKVRAFEAGAVDYITKPFEPAELCARSRAALNTKALMDMLTTQAQLDGLTGLHNRLYFDQRLAQELSAGRRYLRPVGLLMLDVDHFKQINDRFGHPRGDVVLRRIAERIGATCRASDVPCRYGGDEFAVVLPESGAEAALQCGKRIIDAVRRQDDLTALLGVPITVSIGVGWAEPGETITPHALVDRADGALYAAKSSGRDCVAMASLSA